MTGPVELMLERKHGILEMHDEDRTSGTPRLILGIINIILKFVNTEKDDT